VSYFAALRDTDSALSFKVGKCTVFSALFQML
jgi:hypothetical protein